MNGHFDNLSPRVQLAFRVALAMRDVARAARDDQALRVLVPEEVVMSPVPLADLSRPLEMREVIFRPSWIKAMTEQQLVQTVLNQILVRA